MIKPGPGDTQFTQIRQRRSTNIDLNIPRRRGVRSAQGVWKIQSQSLDGKQLERENWFLNVNTPNIREGFRFKILD